MLKTEEKVWNIREIVLTQHIRQSESAGAESVLTILFFIKVVVQEGVLALSKYAQRTVLFEFLKLLYRTLMRKEVHDKILDRMLDALRDQMHENI